MAETQMLWTVKFGSNPSLAHIFESLVYMGAEEPPRKKT